eukprot:g71498.t1
MEYSLRIRNENSSVTSSQSQETGGSSPLIGSYQHLQPTAVCFKELDFGSKVFHEAHAHASLSSTSRPSAITNEILHDDFATDTNAMLGCEYVKSTASSALTVERASQCLQVTACIKGVPLYTCSTLRNLLLLSNENNSREFRY